jgi:hypothetical protein
MTSRRSGARYKERAQGVAVEDLQARLEKLLTDAEDCALIGNLATDVRKRDLFHRLAADLRGMAFDVQAMMALKGAGLDRDIEKPPPGRENGVSKMT